MLHDRPDFKFILEKTDEFSSFDLEAFINVYKEANKP